MSRHNLTDSEWKTIQVFLPAERSGKAGRPWKPHRTVINGILFVLRTGIPWEDLPSEFGKFKTVYNRFRRWVKSGLWDRIFETLIDRVLKAGEIDFELWCVDGTVIRAHRVASGARKSNDGNGKCGITCLGTFARRIFDKAPFSHRRPRHSHRIDCHCWPTQRSSRVRERDERLFDQHVS